MAASTQGANCPRLALDSASSPVLEGQFEGGAEGHIIDAIDDNSQELKIRVLSLEGLASQTPPPLNRSNLDFVTTPQFRITDIQFRLFRATSRTRELLGIF
jgi:hypothetical protein